MGIVLCGVCLITLVFGKEKREGREKTLFIALSALGAILSFVAFFSERGDHIGASLSGMISIFMR